MSCFQGQMNEYKNVALDRFDGRNLKCTAFFLSHCHKDHMVGLNASAFHERLKSRKGIYLYCTELSRLLLLADQEYRHLEKFICVLDVGVDRYIHIPESRDGKRDSHVTVTPISAGHCLGSVMFLFEGNEGTVLYTGDFRWQEEQAARISAFRYQNSVKSIQSMYVDTTFCVPAAFHIPSRNECVEAALSLISDWLDKGRCNLVNVSCPARYGHEHFLLELAKRLGTKVHVPKSKVDVYNNIPELRDYFTDDASLTLLHNCSTKSGFIKTSVLPCGYRLPNGEKLRLLNIRPSAMWFTSGKTKRTASDLIVAPATDQGTHRACYSMHSSYSEIRDLVSFIKPMRVFPNVLPASVRDLMTVQKRLESFIDHPNKWRPCNPLENDDDHELKPLGILRQLQRRTTKLESYESGSDELVFSSPESSPCKRSTTFLYSGIKTTRPTVLSMEKTTTQHSSYWKEDGGCKSPPTSGSLPHHDTSIEYHSSYSGSDLGRGNDDDDEEIDLFSDEHQANDDNKNDCVEDRTDKIDSKDKDNNSNDDCVVTGNDLIESGDNVKNTEESIRVYVSGESEVEDIEDDCNNDDDGGCGGDVNNEHNGKITSDSKNKEENYDDNGSLVKKEEDHLDVPKAAIIVDQDRISNKSLEYEECDSTISYSYSVMAKTIDTDITVGQTEIVGVQQTREIITGEIGDVDASIQGNDVNCDEHKAKEESDDDVIPNSQEIVGTSANKDRYYKSSVERRESKLHLQKQNVIKAPDLTIVNTNENNYVDANISSNHDNSGENESSSNTIDVIDNDKEDIDVVIDEETDCEIIHKESNSTILMRTQNDEFNVISTQSKDNQRPNQSKPSKSGNNNNSMIINQSQPSVIAIEDNGSLEQEDDGCVEFIHEEKPVISNTNNITQDAKGWGWLSKNSGKKLHSLRSNSPTAAVVKAGKYSKGATLSKSNVSLKRKIDEESKDSRWGDIKTTKQRDRLEKVEQGEEDIPLHGNQYYKDKKRNKESVVDLTLDDSL